MALGPLDAGDPRAAPDDRVPAPDDLRPRIAGRATRSGLWLIVGAAALVGVATFAVLASGRSDQTVDAVYTAPTGAGPLTTVSPPPAELLLAETAARSPGYVAPPQTFASPPTLTPPPPPPPPVSYSPPPTIQAAPAPQGPTAQQRRSAPSLIVDLGTGPGAVLAALPSAPGAPGASNPGSARPTSGAAPAAPGGEVSVASTSGGLSDAAGAGAAAVAGATGRDGSAGAALLSNDEQFAERLSGGAADRVRATMLRNPSAVVPQGAMIPGVLETALNSDLPGFARALVSRDVRSFDGSQVLIPSGSRVIGQYRSGVAQGQSRAFIIWTRLIRPDGASIQLASSGTDPLGRAGLEGSVDRHFFQRFGGAILLSVLNAGVAAIGERPSTQVVIGSSQDATGLAAGALAPADISPTIKVPQGSPIRIFVARDLDFSTVGGASR